MNTGNKLYLNGIDATTGQYLVPPMEVDELAAVVKGVKQDEAQTSWFKRVLRKVGLRHYGLPEGVDPADVAQAGWGIVFLSDEDAAVKDALRPLVEHRRRQIGDEKVKELTYTAGQRRAQWLAGNGVGAGSVDPTKVPYYLLLVGSPEKIPFTFCHELDVEYAVGLLHFDKPEEYAQYAQSVIEYETAAGVPNAKEAIFFATRHRDDPPTQTSADLLVNPLADGAQITKYKYRARKLWGEGATKDALLGVLRPTGDAKPPAFLFTASHGVSWPKGHKRQVAAQGALLCQDWLEFDKPGEDDYFAAVDMPADAALHGLIAFHFACYSIGMPQLDNFAHKPGVMPPPIAERPFIAALPKAMLAHPRNGALACIGHVERAWECSIVTEGAGPQLLPFQNTIDCILGGKPVGYAMKDFNQRYAALSTELANVQEQIGFGVAVDDLELANMYIGRNDAGGYLVLGDPAVRVRVDDLK
jgi:hypothetical protein